MDIIQFNKAFQKNLENKKYIFIPLDRELGMKIVGSIEIRNSVCRSHGYKNYFKANKDEVLNHLIRIKKLERSHKDAYASLVGIYFNYVKQKIKREEKEKEDMSDFFSLEGALSAEQERNSGMPEGERFDPID